MRLVHSLLPAFLLVAAGCFGSPSPGADAPRIGTEGPLYFQNGVAQQERGEGEYWLLWLTGTERAELRSGDDDDRSVDCGTGDDFLYRLDRDRERLVYDADDADLSGDFPVLVILDVTGVQFGSSSYGTNCPVERALVPMQWSSGGNATVEVDVPRFGSIELKLFPQGVLALPDQSLVTLGWGAGFNYTRTQSTAANEYWVFGEWRAQNLGAWPESEIVAQ